MGIFFTFRLYFHAMADKNIRIIFLGTPEFAVASLNALLSENYDVCAVVTTPDRPSGRGRKLGMSPVKTFALFP